ncbi:MAG: hypothetical protein D6681_12380 [Calditrichaeota bacterium]|nr:MAG: hypothetical protein D6681_12380 [Calditrichota bacterium]
MANRIIGIENISVEELNRELQRGGKFVVFEYCISIIILTFKRPSSVYFIRTGESTVGKSLKFSLITLLLGWWGIPWGPIYTIGSLITNIRGGKDVTEELLATLEQASVTPSP